jgi:hypothetical protein
MRASSQSSSGWGPASRGAGDPASAERSGPGERRDAAAVGAARRRAPGRLARPTILSLLLLAAVSGLWRCSDQHALLLTIDATDMVETFDIRVKDLDLNRIVLESKGEQITTNADPNRNISVEGQELKVSVEFSGPSHVLVHIVGRGGVAGGELFVAVREFRVDGVNERGITLIPLENDADADTFPSCEAYTNCDVYRNALSCAYLDCDDRPDEGGASIHPFAEERCGNGRDDDCSALCGAAPEAGDEPCVDADGDGSPAGEDCDDTDPCRAPTVFDEDGKPLRSFEARNLCDYQDQAFPALPEACLKKLADDGAAWDAPYCGDGIDQDCDGRDIACVVDDDCDGSPADKDCDDSDPTINPAAQEVCDGKDNNCDGTTDEGCTPCDVDGDGFSARGSESAGCDRPEDGDDFDSGVHPDVTVAAPAGREGGTRAGALRRFCSKDPNKDGIPQREVDHDLDGLAAKDDGCPPDPDDCEEGEAGCPVEDCDKDDDGFAAAGCGDPPPTPDVADCSDDPAVDPDAAQKFPGAPDYCLDTIAQDCQSARTCEGDADGDGYAGADDCGEGDPDRHPWALEVCDGVDNDCDGLVDEGNPDHEGVLISTTAASCTDFSEGECAPCRDGSLSCALEDRQLTGICACSRQVPIRDPQYALDPEQRVACSGEDDSQTPAQRCFVPSEYQPKSEECDERDHDCDGVADDPDGSNLEDVIFGRACSVDQGTCVAGDVTGCDRSRELAFSSLLETVLGDAINVNWLCSDGTVLPRPELCNGRDDDCDGVLPDSPRAADEVDDDGDGYLACSGCNSGEVSGVHDKAEGVTGCNDCNDARPEINPGAAELCNDTDDDCNSDTADGADECAGATPNCCSSLGRCVNLQTDSDNCGRCGQRCTGVAVDRCVGGACVCGSLGRPCAAGQNCEGGTCVCKRSSDGGVCNGCCDGNTCVGLGSQDVGTCGRDGRACASCNDGLSCTDDSCSSGSCRNIERSVGTSCESGSGRCSSDDPPVCCKGCLDRSNGRCRGGTTLSYCGSGGEACDPCSADQCKVASCSSGSCNPRASNISNGTPCDSDSYGCTSQTCQSGTCSVTSVVGCLIAGTCIDEGDPQSPTGDGNCRACDNDNPYNWTSLDGVACEDDGLSCTVDACDSGTCSLSSYTGCVIGGSCRPVGPNSSNGCEICDPAQNPTGWIAKDCDDGLSCTTDGCSGGVCTHVVPPGSGCLTGDNQCGCEIGGTCYAPGTRNPSNDCETCNPASDPTDWTPLTGETCGGSGTCDAGTCDCSPGCVDGGGTCQAGSTAAACGTGGAVCQACNDGRACTDDVCGVGGCSYPVTSGCLTTGDECGCDIGGTCYAPGPNSANECETCNPALNDSGWTALTGDSCGGGTGSCTSGGSCDCSPGCLGAGGTCESGGDDEACATGDLQCEDCLEQGLTCNDAAGVCQ